tara:strand:- start:645 stop:911 length:267 start_codon:yes stop_codon:yes gene_type:complete
LYLASKISLITEEKIMKKPNRKKQDKVLAKGKKKAKKELERKRANKIKAERRLADNIKDRKAEKETWEMKEEIRKIQNKGLTIRNSKV